MSISLDPVWWWLIGGTTLYVVLFGVAARARPLLAEPAGMAAMMAFVFGAFPLGIKYQLGAPEQWQRLMWFVLALALIAWVPAHVGLQRGMAATRRKHRLEKERRAEEAEQVLRKFGA